MLHKDLQVTFRYYQGDYLKARAKKTKINVSLSYANKIAFAKE